MSQPLRGEVLVLDLDACGHNVDVELFEGRLVLGVELLQRGFELYLQFPQFLFFVLDFGDEDIGAFCDQGLDLLFFADDLCGLLFDLGAELLLVGVVLDVLELFLSFFELLSD